MKYKIEIRGNFLLIIEEGTTVENVRHFAKDATYTKHENGANPLYKLVGKEQPFVYKNEIIKYFSFDDLQDKDGVAFTSVAVFEDLLNTSLGKPNASGTGSYTEAELIKTIRKTLNPYKLVTYLDEATPFTTDVIPADTPFKLLIPTTVAASNGFAIEDIGGGNLAYKLTAVAGFNEPFEVRMTTTITASASNVEFILYGYINGVKMPGVTAEKAIGGGGAAFAQVAMMSESMIAHENYIEVWVETDKPTTLTFLRTAINIVESN